MQQSINHYLASFILLIQAINKICTTRIAIRLVNILNVSSSAECWNSDENIVTPANWSGLHSNISHNTKMMKWLTQRWAVRKLSSCWGKTNHKSLGTVPKTASDFYEANSWKLSWNFFSGRQTVVGPLLRFYLYGDGSVSWKM